MKSCIPPKFISQLRRLQRNRGTGFLAIVFAATFILGALLIGFLVFILVSPSIAVSFEESLNTPRTPMSAVEAELYAQLYKQVCTGRNAEPSTAKLDAFTAAKQSCANFTNSAPQHHSLAEATAFTFPYSLVIIVFTYNRLEGLQRLLTSLVNADYLGRTDIELRVFFDFKKHAAVKGQERTRAYLEKFRWPHGPMTVHKRVRNAGLKTSILEGWYPLRDDEIAAFFEDDIEVAPQWFAWADRAIRTYALQFELTSSFTVRDIRHVNLLGISLYRPIKDELSGSMTGSPTSDFSPFLLQQPCSWGALYFAKPWRAFRNWYDKTKGEGGVLKDPADPQIKPQSNTWADESSWKKFLIKLMYQRGWFMVYPNLPLKMVLSTNHLMVGEHKTPPRDLFELPLVPAEVRMENERGDANDKAEAATAYSDAELTEVREALHRLPPLEQLKVFNVMFKKVDGITNLPNYEKGVLQASLEKNNNEDEDEPDA